MAYNSLIPKSTDTLSLSQGDILANFTALGAIAGNTNPASGSLNATSGFNWVYLPSQGSTPPAGSAFPAGDVAMYSFVNATTTRKELYINKTTAAGVLTQIPATAAKVTASAAIPGAATSRGWTYLPSGALMVWGDGYTTAGAGFIAVLYSSVTGFPGFTISGTPLVTRFGAPGSSSAMILTAASITGFTTYATAPFTTGYYFTWFAIGQ